MPANLAWYDKRFYADNAGSSAVVTLEGAGATDTEVRLMSEPVWRPCEGRGIAVPISWNSQTSEDTDTVCFTDGRGRSALIGHATSARDLLRNTPAGVIVELASNPVLCDTTSYVDFGGGVEDGGLSMKVPGEDMTHVFTRAVQDGGSPFMSCDYPAGGGFGEFLRSVRGDLEMLEKCNQWNGRTLGGEGGDSGEGAGEGRPPGCPVAEGGCARTFRQKAVLHNRIINHGGRFIREQYPNLTNSYQELPGKDLRLEVCYGSWPYMEPMPPKINDTWQNSTMDVCNELMPFKLYENVVKFTANILYDQAVNLALAQKQLEIAQSISLTGMLAVVFIAAVAAIGALPGARQVLVSLSWGWDERRRLWFVSIGMTIVGLMSAFSVWQLLYSIKPYLKSSYYYIPVSTQHEASFTPQPLYFIGFAIVQVRGESGVLYALIAGGIVITCLVIVFSAYAYCDHLRRRKLLANHTRYITFDTFGAAESLTEADALLLHCVWRQLRPSVDATESEVSFLKESILPRMYSEQEGLSYRMKTVEENLDLEEGLQRKTTKRRRGE